MSDIDTASAIALASAVVSLAYSLAQGPLKDIGWLRLSNRLLDLSEKLDENGAEGRARRFLRDEAVIRILRAKRFRESISSGLPKYLNRLSVASLLALTPLCIAIVVQSWMGGVHQFVMIAYTIVLAFMCVCSIGSVIALLLRNRRIRQTGWLREPKAVGNRQRREHDDEHDDESRNESKHVE